MSREVKQPLHLLPEPDTEPDLPKVPFTTPVADAAREDFRSWLLCEQIVLENTTPGAERIETAVAIARAVVEVSTTRLRACKVPLTEVLAAVRAAYMKHEAQTAGNGETDG